MSNSRILRILRAFPEVGVILGLGLVFSVVRRLVPPVLQGSLGWQLHPYQVFAVCVALAIFCLPGAMLLRLLRVGGSWWTRLPSSFAASVSLWSVPGLAIALAARFDLNVLLLGGAAVTSLVALAAYVRELRAPSTSENMSDDGRVDLGDPQNIGLSAVGILALVAMAWISFRAPVALDDNLQLGYVQDNMVVPRINALEPIFNAGIRPNTRGSFTTWPLILAVIAFISGLPPQQAFWLLRTPLVLLSIFSVYSLALRLFGRRNQAIFTAVLYCLLAVILTSESDAIGFGLFARSAQDKFVARYALYPITLAWSMAYLFAPSRRYYWLAGILTLGLAVTHPIGIILLAISLGGLGAVHILRSVQGIHLRVTRVPWRWRTDLRPSLWWSSVKELVRLNWPVLRPFMFLAIFSLVGVVIPAIQQASPDAPVVAYSLTDTHDPSLWARINLVLNNYRLYIANGLGPAAYIVHPRIFLSPVILLPGLLLPLFWARARNWPAIELIVGTYIFDPLLLLVPPLVQFIGSHSSPWLLYRFAWPLSLLGPMTIGWAGWELIEIARRRIRTPRIGNVLPVTLLALTAILLSPGFLYGLTVLKELRQDPLISRCRTLQPLLSQLPQLAGTGTVVLSTPDMNVCIPTSAPDAYPVEYFLTSTINRFPESRIPEAEQRIADVYAFVAGQVVDQEFMDILTRWNVGLILLREDHPLASQLRHLPHLFRLELEQDRYLIYRVVPGSGTEVSADLADAQRWKLVKWEGQDALVEANTLWAEGHLDEAIAAYRQLQSDGDQHRFLAHVGEGRSELSAGRIDQGIAAYASAVDADPEDAQVWLVLGEAYQLIGDYTRMAQAEEAAVAQIPWHPEALQRLGDAYRLLGRNADARQGYQRAVAADSIPGSSSYFYDLGMIYSDANWPSDAVAAFQASLSIRKSVLTYASLSEVYRKQGDRAAAADAAGQSHRLEFWSALPFVTWASLALDNQDTEGALENLRKAVSRDPQSQAVPDLAMAVSFAFGDQSAMEEVEQLIGYKLGFSKPLLASAQLELGLGDFEAGLASGLQVWQWQPVYAPAAVFLGQVNHQLGHDDAADRFYRDAIAVSPLDPTAYLGLATVAQKQGEMGKALGWALTARVTSPYSSDTAIGLGDIYADMGKMQLALDTFRRAASDDPSSPSPLVALGEYQLDQGDLEQAVQTFRTALAVRPATPSAYRGLGSAQANLGLPSEATDSVRAAIQLKPGMAVNHTDLGRLLLPQGYQEEALREFKMALNLAPGRVLTRMALGLIYARLDQESQEEGVYEELIRVMPHLVDGYIGLGNMRERQGDTGAAAALYQQALEQVSPSISGRAGIALGELESRNGEFDRAQASFEAVIRQEPMLDDGYLASSHFYAQRGRFWLAASIIKRGLELMPASPGLNAALARLQVDQGDVNLALQIYQAAMRVAPGSTELRMGFANLLASIGDPQRAMQEVRNALRAAPGDAELLAQAVSTAIDVGQPAEALAMARDLAALAPGSATSWMTLANASAFSGHFEDAEAAYLRALSTEPGAMQPWLALGRFYVDRSRGDEAIVALNQAIATDRSSPEPHLALGQLYDSLGQPERAIEEYQTAATLDGTQSTGLLSAGRIEVRRGNIPRAQEWFDKALAANPSDPLVYEARAHLLELQGRFVDARIGLLDATRVAPGSCQAILNLADFVAEHGERTDAEDAYHKAMTLAECSSEAHVSLGTLYSLMGESAYAYEEYQKGVETDPGSPWGYISLAAAQSGQMQPDDARQTLEEAAAHIPASEYVAMATSRHLATQGKLEDGLKAAQQAVNLKPSNAAGLLTLGAVFETSGDLAGAESSYSQAAAADRSQSLAHVYLGSLYERSARFEAAEDEYRQAIALTPSDPAAYVALGDFLHSRGRGSEALDVYEQGAEVDRSRIEALLALGGALQMQGDTEGAEAAIQRAFELGPSSAIVYGEKRQSENALATPPLTLVHAYVAHGDLLRLTGDWQGAELAYRQAILTAPGETPGYLRLGDTFLALGRMNEAKAQYETALAATPSSVAANLALGDLYTLLADWKGATEAYRAAIEADMTGVQAHVSLGGIYQTQGHFESASSEFETAPRMSPGSALAQVSLGQWKRSRADLAAAEAAYLKAIAVAAADPLAYTSLGDLYQAVGRRGDALTMYEKAAELAPTSGAAYIALGDWYSLEADWAGAEKQYRRAVEVAPDEITGYLRLGGALQSLGRSGDAWTMIHEALRLSPASGEARVALGDWSRLNVNVQAAQQALEEARANASGDVKELTRTGLDFMAGGDVEDAFAHFEEAVQVDPDSVLPYVAMGQSYRLSAQLSSAEQAYLDTVEATPGELDGYVQLAKLYMDEGRTREATAQLQRAVELFQTSTAFIALGDTRRTQGQWAGAEDAYRQAIRLEPGEVLGYLRLAELYRIQGRRSDEISVLEEGVLAGLSDAVAVCGPGILPGGGADALSEANASRSVLSWRCQWKRRPWADQFGSEGSNASSYY